MTTPQSSRAQSSTPRSATPPLPTPPLDTPRTERDTRAAELATALESVRGRIDSACAASGRESGEITLIGITKTYPAADARILADLGVLDLGENRAVEARDKAGEVPDARWHFVGQLQSNKARVVARFAVAVHSVDRVGLVHALDRASADAVRPPVEVFLQVSLDGDEGRGGVLAGQLDALADEADRAAHLRLVGVMAVAPQEQDAGAAFTRLQALSAGLVAGHPQATAISAGMSNDLEAAIAHGATHVRVGSALLGRRPPVVS